MPLSKENRDILFHILERVVSASRPISYHSLETPTSSPSLSNSSTLTNPKETRHDESAAEVISHIVLTPPPSPCPNFPRRACKATVDEKQSHLDAPTLKSLLGLKEWCCGAGTQKNEPCTRAIRLVNRDRIDSHINSLLKLIRTFSDFGVELEELASLVHCWQHTWRLCTEARVKSWTVALSPKTTALNELSVERRIRDGLGQVPAQCSGITVQGRHCTKPLARWKVLQCTETIDEIVTPRIYEDDKALDRRLLTFGTNTYCRSHITQSLAKIAEWKTSIAKILVKADAKSKPSTSRVTLKSPESEISPKELRSSLSTPKSNPSKRFSQFYNKNPFNIIERGRGTIDAPVSLHKLQRKLTAPLGSKDEGDGYPYVSQNPANKAFVKFGYTKRTPDLRKEESKYHCNRELHLLYPVPSDLARIPVPHARRVEALCHAELHHHRVLVKCEGCSKTHREWFEVSVAEAIAVVRKWSLWITREPYEQLRELRSGLRWYLKEEEKRKVQDIKRFMEQDLVVDASKVASELVLRKAAAAFIQALEAKRLKVGS
ncbi:hypothetical protein MMC25_004529 [Agyrium rufum]|nr:hypothetical protein [Agyrium rufum]